MSSGKSVLMVIAHNGTIQVQSQIGGGSTFLVRLPITEELESPGR